MEIKYFRNVCYRYALSTQQRKSYVKKSFSSLVTIYYTKISLFSLINGREKLVR